MHVEVRAAGRDIATFRSEVEGEIRVAFDVDGATIEIPLEELERAISAAREEVHAESFYPYPDKADDPI